ncbi:MAG: diacylglycerol kinase family lipid kinase [Chloroflexi bacterium]|nr:diacylglycerol kinase family lipid kinase [Chloroflexota bacterium]
MTQYKIIVNPVAGKGRAAHAANEIKRVFDTLETTYDLVETSQPGEAIVIAQQAVAEGYDVLVAVGGDGTTHEIINGLMSSCDGKDCRLAIIPVGSGNDFAAVNNVPFDIEQACKVVIQGNARLVDIGHLRIDDTIDRYFSNTVGIGLDGMVNIEARKLPRLRGLLLYFVALLKTVFISLKPFHIDMMVDGVTITQSTLMVSIANGRREGGGFLIAPLAKQDDGLLDLVYTAVLSHLGVLRMIPLFLKGTHLGHPAIKSKQAERITIKSDDPMYMHADGEILGGAAHCVEIEVIPRKLQLISG